MTTSTPMPAWLREHLIQTGKIDRDAITRRAKARYCPTCQQLTLVGLSADRAALATRCDPTPLSPLGEALAQVVDRSTFALFKSGDRLELHARDSFGIAGSPAGSPRAARFDVLAEHQCGAPALPSTESVHATTARQEYATCPF